MFRLILSILFAFIGAILYFLYLYVYMKYQNMILNHKIRIFKEYFITIDDEADNGKSVLFDGNNQLDIVKGLREKISGWYVITEQGYYVFSRFKRKMTFLEELNGQKGRAKKIFSEPSNR